MSRNESMDYFNLLGGKIGGTFNNQSSNTLRNDDAYWNPRV